MPCATRDFRVGQDLAGRFGLPPSLLLESLEESPARWLGVLPDLGNREARERQCARDGCVALG